MARTKASAFGFERSRDLELSPYAASTTVENHCARTSHFNEYEFYSFGLQIGLANLMRNGFRLGLKKTLGKIAQPINSYTRFPEYALMDEAIRHFLQGRKGSEIPRALDVGSPKCFGLYLASKMYLEVELTDLSPLNVDEYKIIWEAIRKRAKGLCSFSIQDARALRYEANQFDAVYSMSVVEHIEGKAGDSEAINEMARVIKPGGLLLLSVPFGEKYVEQLRKGFVHAIEKTNDESLYFFQRIYDRSALEKRILSALTGLRARSAWTIWRKSNLPVRVFQRLGENLQGLFGFLNPWLSFWSNRCEAGIVQGSPGSYGQIHSSYDVCGDVVLIAEKGAN
jgi:SAM-dependent methyltransferase